MHARPVASLSAVTLVAALGLVGCSDPVRPAASQSLRTTLGTPLPTAPAAAPLPSADVLAGVLYRLADTSVPVEQKVGLVQYATVDDKPALANFGEALKASGFNPLVVQATDMTWAGDPGHVVANVTIGSPDPNVKAFTFPMEFSPIRDAWQLSRRTADQLLPVVGTAPPPR